MHWINKKSVEELISLLSQQKGEIRPKLLGYLHLQLNKSKMSTTPSPLEMSFKFAESEEIFRYLVINSKFSMGLYFLSITVPKDFFLSKYPLAAKIYRVYRPLTLFSPLVF